MARPCPAPAGFLDGPAKREQGAQDAAAIHRIRGEQVKEEQYQVAGGDALSEIGIGGLA